LRGSRQGVVLCLASSGEKGELATPHCKKTTTGFLTCVLRNDLSNMGVKPGFYIYEMNMWFSEGVREQGAEDNIWT
jgi:hypothetical protein